MIKVSVIIPVYNVERYLEECLESVINQTLKEIEIICVNDDSPDDSREILAKYSAMDSRIHILDNVQNYGLSYSRNRGIEISKGEYIYFLDSDDMITPEAMEELYTVSTQQKLDGVFFDASQIFETELLREEYIKHKLERNNEYLGVFTGQELFVKFINNNDWISLCQCQFWRREYLLHQNLRFYEGIIYEDILFTVLALIKAKRVGHVATKYFIYRRRENSIIISKISKRNLESIFICYCEILLFWQQGEFKEDVNQAVDTYISILYKLFMKLYKELCDKVTIKEISQGSVIVNHLFKNFVLNMEGDKICKTITSKKLSTIKEYKNIVIYGAGKIGRDVLEVLDRNGIGIFGFAVSEKEGNPKYIMGNSVYSIEELVGLQEHTIILISVIPKYQQDILRRLEELDFGNVIIMLEN